MKKNASTGKLQGEINPEQFEHLTKHKVKQIQSASSISPLKSPPKSKISSVINMLFGNFENDHVI